MTHTKSQMWWSMIKNPNIGWGLLWKILFKPSKERIQQNRIKSIDLHPTENWILATTISGNIYVWDISKKVIIKWFKVSQSPTRAGKFIARKNWIVAGCFDGSIYVYDYNTMQLVKDLYLHRESVRSIIVHPTLPFFFSCGDDGRILCINWDKDWTVEREFGETIYGALDLKFNPHDSSIFASASNFDNPTVQLWKIDDEKPISEFKHDKGTNTVNFHPSEPLLVSTSDDGYTSVWNYKTGECVQKYYLKEECNIAQFYGNNILSSYNDGSLVLWPAKTELHHNFGRVWCMEPDGDSLWLGSDVSLIKMTMKGDTVESMEVYPFQIESLEECATFPPNLATDNVIFIPRPIFWFALKPEFCFSNEYDLRLSAKKILYKDFMNSVENLSNSDKKSTRGFMVFIFLSFLICAPAAIGLGITAFFYFFSYTLYAPGHDKELLGIFGGFVFALIFSVFQYKYIKKPNGNLINALKIENARYAEKGIRWQIFSNDTIGIFLQPHLVNFEEMQPGKTEQLYAEQLNNKIQTIMKVQFDNKSKSYKFQQSYDRVLHAKIPEHEFYASLERLSKPMFRGGIKRYLVTFYTKYRSPILYLYLFFWFITFGCYFYYHRVDNERNNKLLIFYRILEIINIITFLSLVFLTRTESTRMKAEIHKIAKEMNKQNEDIQWVFYGANYFQYFELDLFISIDPSKQNEAILQNATEATLYDDEDMETKQLLG